MRTSSTACLYYCLSHSAIQAIEDDITVEQFSGAMTNMVYRCGLLQAGREVQASTPAPAPTSCSWCCESSSTQQLLQLSAI
jgi:hypothetical protein